MAQVLGADRAAAVCRELTKTHEEVVRGGLADLAVWAGDGVRGEVTVVVAGHAPGGGVRRDAAELARLVAEEEARGASRKDAIRAVAQRTGQPRREVYDAVHRGPAGVPESVEGSVEA
jgi:16S rRNA (cytidine1402-2'-O)-methyltransferase